MIPVLFYWNHICHLHLKSVPCYWHQNWYLARAAKQRPQRDVNCRHSLVEMLLVLSLSSPRHVAITDSSGSCWRSTLWCHCSKGQRGENGKITFTQLSHQSKLNSLFPQKVRYWVCIVSGYVCEPLLLWSVTHTHINTHKHTNGGN